MERPDLVSAGRKTGDPEVAEGIRDQVFLDTFDDHFGARQNAPVQAVDYDSGDFRLCPFSQSRPWVSVAVAVQPAAAQGEMSARPASSASVPIGRITVSGPAVFLPDSPRAP